MPAPVLLAQMATLHAKEQYAASIVALAQRHTPWELGVKLVVGLTPSELAHLERVLAMPAGELVGPPSPALGPVPALHDPLRLR